jgi:hypothetical protein
MQPPRFSHSTDTIEVQEEIVYKQAQLITTSSSKLYLPIAYLKTLQPASGIMTVNNYKLKQLADLLTSTCHISIEFFKKDIEIPDLYLEYSYELSVNDTGIVFEFINGHEYKRLATDEFHSYASEEIVDYIQNIRFTDMAASRQWLADYSYSVVTLISGMNDTYKQFIIKMLVANGHEVEDLVYAPDSKILYCRYNSRIEEVSSQMKKIIAVGYVLFPAIVSRLPAIVLNIDTIDNFQSIVNMMQASNSQLIFSTSTGIEHYNTLDIRPKHDNEENYN